MTRVFCGLDVCKNRVVAWLAFERPRNVKQYFKQEVKNRDRDPMKDSLTFYYNRGGMEQLFKLDFDAIVLEPTGIHYSTLPAQIAKAKGIKVLWVGHQQVANFRKTHKLPDKSDLADAYILAIYGLEHYSIPDYFLVFPEEKLARIRELYLQSKFNSRISTPLISRVKAQLSHEFPEAMDTKIDRAKDGRSPLICWLAQREREGVRKYSYWPNRYNKSVAVEYGIEISQFTRIIAGQIDDCHQHRAKLEKELRELVFSGEFMKYNQIFNDFKFDLHLRAIILSLTYPLSNFATLGQFKRRLGATKEENSSGDSVAWKSGNGSVLCHSQMYLWVMDTIAHRYGTVPRNGHTSEAMQRVQAKYDEWLERFNSSETALEEIAKAKAQQKATKTVARVLRNVLGDAFKKESEPIINLIIGMVNSKLANAMQEDNNQKEFKVNKAKAKINLGKLIIGKTIAYAVRLLYKELARNV